MHNPRFILAKDLTVTGMPPHLIISSANRSSLAYTFRQGIYLARIRSFFGYPTHLGNSRLGLSRAYRHRSMAAYAQSAIVALWSGKHYICVLNRSGIFRMDFCLCDLYLRRSEWILFGLATTAYMGSKTRRRTCISLERSFCHCSLFRSRPRHICLVER